MKIEKWLSNVYYDEYGTHIWNKVDKDGGSQLVADIRGWGRIQNEFKTEEEAVKFQDEVGKFIVQAIREKIAKLNQVPDVRKMVEISDEEIYKEAEHKSKIFRGWTEYETSAWVMACQWYREQLKKKQ